MKKESRLIKKCLSSSVTKWSYIECDKVTYIRDKVPVVHYEVRIKAGGINGITVFVRLFLDYIEASLFYRQLVEGQV